jgi:hypothetical protein
MSQMIVVVVSEPVVVTSVALAVVLASASQRIP